MLNQSYFSIVSPVYNGELLVNLLVDRIIAVFKDSRHAYEIVLVDDGSVDGSRALLKELAGKYSFIKVILLTGNHGQHIAIKAGLDFCIGDWVVVMDCDLQDEPEAISSLIQALEKNTDAVFAHRDKQSDAVIKRFYSSLFYSILGLETGIPFSGSTANFGLYSRRLINEVCAAKYAYFFLPIAVRKYALKTIAVDVKHAPRAAGETGYSFKKAMTLAWQIISSNGVFAIFKRKEKVLYSIQEKINFINDTI